MKRVFLMSSLMCYVVFANSISLNSEDGIKITVNNILDLAYLKDAFPRDFSEESKIPLKQTLKINCKTHSCVITYADETNSYDQTLNEERRRFYLNPDISLALFNQFHNELLVELCPKNSSCLRYEMKAFYVTDDHALLPVSDSLARVQCVKIIYKNGSNYGPVCDLNYTVRDQVKP